MNSTIPRLKPLALILAASFPVFAQAAPSVSASGYYQFSGYDNDPAELINISDSFAQAATPTAFSQIKYGAYTSWISTSVASSSDGQGHFGSDINNSLTFPQGLTQKAGTQITFTDTITNNTSNTQNVSFNFNIDSVYIFTFKGIPMGISPMVNTASFAANIDVNGATVWSTGFSTAQTNPTTIVSQTTGSSIGLAPQAIDPYCSMGSFYGCSFLVENYTNTLNLGPLAANASLTVTYSVKLDTETNAYGGASSISFSDPAGIAAGNTGTGAPMLASLQFAAPVPEPEQASMLLAGLALIGVAAKRRRKSR